MIVGLIGDTHWGAMNDSPVYQSALSRFFREVFFPTIIAKGVTHVIHVGDVFHRRKSINTLTLNQFHEDFMKPLIDNEITLDVIVGNHDCYYTNTNKVNSVQGVLQGYVDNNSGINVITEPCTQLIRDKYDEYHVVYLPWVTPENFDKTIETIKNAKKHKIPLVFGHLEIDGSYAGRGRPYEGGFNRSVFKEFSHVISGHIHHRSQQGNITYLSSPVEQNWGETDAPHGFGILDVITGELQFIDNPNPLYKVIEYTGEKGEEKKLKDIENKIVRVVVVEKPSDKAFAKFTDKLSEHNPSSIEIVDKETYTTLDTPENVEEASFTDTRDIILQFVDEQIEGTDEEKELLKDILTNSYDSVTR